MILASRAEIPSQFRWHLERADIERERYVECGRRRSFMPLLVGAYISDSGLRKIKPRGAGNRVPGKGMGRKLPNRQDGPDAGFGRFAETAPNSTSKFTIGSRTDGIPKTYRIEYLAPNEQRRKIIFHKSPTR